MPNHSASPSTQLVEVAAVADRWSPEEVVGDLIVGRVTVTAATTHASSRGLGIAPSRGAFVVAGARASLTVNTLTTALWLQWR